MVGSGSCGSGYPGSVMETAEEKVARVELENAQLRDRVARVAERPGELEHRPGLNGGNSGKPPSSDGLKKPAAARRTRSLRGKTGRQPGGQASHAGHEGRTLCRTGRPDRVKEHVPAVCRGCGASLRSASAVGRPVARRVFDLPEPRPPEVTAHSGHACRCGRCGVASSRSVSAGAAVVGGAGCVVRGARVAGDPGEYEPAGGGASACCGRAYGGAGGPQGACEASGRDRASPWRSHAVASCDARPAAGGVSGERAARGCARGCERDSGARPLAMLLADGGGSTRFARRIACGRYRRLWRATRRTGRGACRVICCGRGEWRVWRGSGALPFRGGCWRGLCAAATGCLSRR